jgi:hypothetical protein
MLASMSGVNEGIRQKLPESLAGDDSAFLSLCATDKREFHIKRGVMQLIETRSSSREQFI